MIEMSEIFEKFPAFFDSQTQFLFSNPLVLIWLVSFPRVLIQVQHVVFQQTPNASLSFSSHSVPAHIFSTLCWAPVSKKTCVSWHLLSHNHKPKATSIVFIFSRSIFGEILKGAHFGIDIQCKVENCEFDKFELLQQSVFRINDKNWRPNESRQTTSV